MAQVIKLRRSATPGNEPTTGELNLGELAINTNDGRLFTLKSVSGSLSVVEFLNTASATDLYVDVAGDTMTGNLVMGSQVQHRASRASQLLPSYAFEIDADTGMFRPGTDILGLATGGVEFFRISRPQVLFGQTSLDGSSTFPTISFRADPNTGFYQPNNDELNVTVGGSVMLRIDNGSSVTVIAPLHGTAGTAAIPGISFADDPNTGMYLPGGSALGFSVDGDQFIRASSGGIHFISDGGNRLQIVSNAITACAQIRAFTGNAKTTPSFTFTGATTTGLFREFSVTERVGLSLGGSVYALLVASTVNAILPGADADINLGASTLRYNVVFASRLSFTTLDGTVAVSFPLLADPNGSAPAPAYSFDSDPDTGMFRITTNTLGLAAGASTMLRIQSTSAISALAPFHATSGSVGVPAIAFQADADTGIHLPTAGTLAFGVGSGSTFTMTATRNIAKVELHLPDGSADNPSLTFEANSNTGMFRPAGNELGFTAGASLMLKIDQGSSVTVIAQLVPGADRTFDLGSTNVLWDTVFASNYTAAGGTALLPAYSFLADPDTGMDQIGVNLLGFSAGGSTMMRLDNASSVTIIAPLHIQSGSAGGPALAIGDADTGLFLQTAGILGITASGVSTLTASAAGVVVQTRLFSLPAGTAASPAFGFATDTDTGMYLAGVGTLAFTTGDNQSLRASAAAVVVAACQILLPRGSASVPAMAFSDDLDTGIFRNGTSVAFSVAGANQGGVGACHWVTTKIQAQSGVVASPSYTFSSDNDTGMNNTGGGGGLQLVVDGSAMMHLGNGSSVTVIAPLHPGADVTHNLGSSALRWNVVFASRISYTTLDPIPSATVSFPLLASPSGTDDAPAYSFASEPDAGMFLSASGHVSFSIAASQVMTVSAGGVSLSSRFSGPNGSAGGATYGFNGVTAQGMYRNPSTGATTFTDSVGQDRLAITSDRLRLSTLVVIANGGSESTPAYGFTGDVDTGMYRPNIGLLGFTVNGSTMLHMDQGSSVTVAAPLEAQGGVDLSGGDLTLSGSGRILIPDGNGSVPSLAFANDPNTGFSRTVLDSISFITGGTESFRVDSGTAAATDGCANVPGYRFLNDGDTGMFRVTTDILALSAGGSAMLQIDRGSSVTVIAPMEIHGVLSVGTITTSNFQVNASNIALFATGRNVQFRGSNITVSAANVVFLSAGSTVDIQSGDLTLSGCGQILLANGSVGAPGIAFASNTNAGMYRPGTGFLGLAANGGSAMTLTSTQAKGNTGGAVNPGWTFMGNDSTGMYLPSTGTLGFSASGLEIFTASSTAIELKKQLLAQGGGSGAPGISFESDPDTGMLWVTTNVMGFAAGASIMMRVAFGSSVTFTAPIHSQDGLVGTPEYSFRNDVDTGMYLPVVGRLGFAVAGSNIVNITDSAIAAIQPGVDLGANLGASTLRYNAIFASRISYTTLDPVPTAEVSFPLFAPSGSAGAPSYSFEGASTMGITALFSDTQIGFGIGGVTRMRLEAGSLLSSTLQFISKIGTASSPTYSFQGTSTAGMFRAVTNGLGFAASGLTALTINHNTIRSSSANIEMRGGSNANPAYSFATDPDTGMYIVGGGGVLAFSVSGGQAIRASTAGVVVVDQLLIDAGNVGTPGIAFEVDPDTGIYFKAANQMGLVAGGVRHLSLQGSQVLVGMLGSNGVPSLSWENDPDSGFLLNNPGHLALSVSGIRQWTASSRGTNFLTSIALRSASPALPGLTFANDSDTGIVGSAFNGFSLVTGASVMIGIQEGSGVTVRAPLHLGFAGSAGAPTIEFPAATNTGIYQFSTTSMGFTCNGTNAMTVATNFIGACVQIRARDGTSGNTGYAFSSETTSGLFHFNSRMGINVSGSAWMHFVTSATNAIQPETTNLINIGASSLRYNAMFASRVSATDLEGSLADVAERYSADGTGYDAGTVMIFGGPAEIMECSKFGDTRVAGVISATPFIKMNRNAGPDATHPYLAMKGRVPCKMYGPVGKGDLITTSDKKGYGQAATGVTAPWAVFAKSLEDSTAASALIEVVVQ